MMTIRTMHEWIEETGTLPVVLVSRDERTGELRFAKGQRATVIDDPTKSDVWCVTAALSWSASEGWVETDHRTVSHIPTGLAFSTVRGSTKQAISLLRVLKLIAPEYGRRWKGGAPQNQNEVDTLQKWLNEHHRNEMERLGWLRRALGEQVQP